MSISNAAVASFLAFIGIVLVISFIFAIYHAGYINGKFPGACEYAGGSVTDTVCIDGDTVLFTYETWNE